MGLPLQTENYYNNSGGLDLKSSPTKVPEVKASLSLNVDYSIDGAFATRNGSTIMNQSDGIPQQIAGAPKTLLLYDYRKSDGTQVNIICAGTSIYHSLVTPVAQVTGLSASLPHPDIEFVVTNDNEYALWGNGVDTNLKFDGSTWTNLSITDPGNPTVAPNGAGTLTGDFEYYVQFQRQVGGVAVQVSDLNPVAQTITAAANIIQITRPASPDSQVTHWTLFRLSPTSTGVYYQIVDGSGDPVTIAIATTTYDDNIADDGTIEAEFDNQAAPTSAIIETDDFGQTWYIDADRLTDALVSKPYKPWNVPSENLQIFDGRVQCAKRCFGTIVFGTDRSLWVQNGSFDTTDSRKFSSKIGILNNRCAVGDESLYILGTNRKFYPITPTDFSQNEMRLTDNTSLEVEPLLQQINAANIDEVCMEYYTTATVAKVMISAPLGVSTNNSLIVYNESQSQNQQDPCWQFWNNTNASALRLFEISGVINLYSGDYNGFLWKLDDDSTNGDGAEVNGTVTSSTNTTLTDSTLTLDVNEMVGKTVRIISGVGEDQVRTIISNTSTTLTVSAWDTNPTTSSEYTIGGYDVYHFCNWKFVLVSYDTLKQLWYLWANANASGDYNITIILQTDFDTTVTNQVEILFNLTSANTIWGSFIWGEAVWGAQSVFQDRIRQYARFRAIRLGFQNRKAGQPFQINGFSISSQDKKLFFRSAA